MRPNGEVEGPHDHTQQATRAHTVFPRPRRQTRSASRPLQRLLDVAIIRTSLISRTTESDADRPWF